jgi:putative Mg2+ transporter-C (MgtC) family protein
MVSVGACIFTASGLFFFPGHQTDPTRIAAQVVTGVGFLGAGAIFRAEDGVKGLTTAATVWVVASLGMTVGFGLYVLAFAGAVIVLLGLVVVRPIEVRFLRHGDHPMRRRDDEVR